MPHQFYGTTPSSDSSSMRIHWPSIYVIYFIIFVSEAGRGLVLPSQWPYLKFLGGSDAFLGVIVGSFSFGRMLATIPLGYLSDVLSMRWVLIVSSLIQIFGNVLYVFASGKYSLLFSRIIVGLGSATMSVCRAHITRAVVKKERTPHFAYLSALQFVGFGVLPGVGGLLELLPVVRIGSMAFNMFTYPAWLLMLTNLLGILSLLFLYVDPPSSEQMASYEANLAASSHQQNTPEQKLLVPAHTQVSVDALAKQSESGHDVLALLTCLLINVCFRGAVAQLETISAPFLMSKYGLDMEAASFKISIMGLFGLGIYVTFGIVSKFIADRASVITGLGFLVIGAIVLGQSWFSINLGLYVMALGCIWSLAYPIGQTAILSLFSKLIGNLPAGSFLGIFSMCGSLARVVFAILASATWQVIGDEAVFIIMAFYGGVSLLLLMFLYPRMIGRS